MSRLRLAIVGCGSICERGLLPHLLLERDRVQVSALCDMSEARLEMLAEKFAVPKTFTNVEELLHTSEAEAIAIATPIPLHYEQARSALLQGRHVYVQKTMTQTVKEAEELIRIAKEQGLVLAASPGQMLLPAYWRARELVTAGALGIIYTAFGINMAPGHEHEALRKHAKQADANVDPTWYYRAGSGPLRDMGVYSLHAITGILGRARKVLSFANRPMPERSWNNKSIPVEVDDNIALILELEQHRLATVCTTFSADPPIRSWGLAISGSEGALDIRRLPGKTSRYELMMSRMGETNVEPQEFGTGLDQRHEALEEAHVARDLLDFVDAVLNARPPQASAEHACHVIAIIEAAECAARTGSVVEIPRTPHGDA
ncbi:MAG: Gfo/Idh/MocA family protein [Anaerolineae bacterium]